MCVSIACVSPHIISCCRQHTRMHTERSLCTRRGRRSRQPKILHQRKKKDVSRSITHTRFPPAQKSEYICYHAPNSSCPLAYTYPCKYVQISGLLCCCCCCEREREREECWHGTSITTPCDLPPHLLYLHIQSYIRAFSFILKNHQLTL